ncbi:MAG: hypothetical protein QOI35_499 [Cryptosporangiaceae bacterium]|nr:hypothetical protein [Cryptosporangiaceae bacterium]
MIGGWVALVVALLLLAAIALDTSPSQDQHPALDK